MKIKQMLTGASMMVALVATGGTQTASQARILIDRALNSPTLSIRYAGASAVRAELRVNGKIQATRSLSTGARSGETTFTLDPANLKNGENDIEILLFAASGSLVGREKTRLMMEAGRETMVALTHPKMGASAQGLVPIEVGLGPTVQNAYVSFFINNEFRSMSNFPPFRFQWDTSAELNGWHEVEAWVVDGERTYKTAKTRVYVNNPGGRTDRRTALDLLASENPDRYTLSGTEAGLRPLGSQSTAVQGDLTARAPQAPGIVLPNGIHAQIIDRSMGLKAMPKQSGVATGPQHLTPTGERNAPSKPTVQEKPTAPEKPPVQVAQKTPPAAPIQAVKQAASVVAVQHGFKLEQDKTFSIVYKGVELDVELPPQTMDGIPMAPFRHIIEKAGGKLKWEHLSKQLSATAEGRRILVQIGQLKARVNDREVDLDYAPTLVQGRTFVPVSFLQEALDVKVEFDTKTKHVLITAKK